MSSSFNFYKKKRRRIIAAKFATVIEELVAIRIVCLLSWVIFSAQVLFAIEEIFTIILKYGFCNKSFRKDEPLTSWTLLQHICPHFWAWLLLYSEITPKSEDKYVVKVFNWSDVHLSEMTLLQSPYFSTQWSHPSSFCHWCPSFSNNGYPQLKLLKIQILNFFGSYFANL